MICCPACYPLVASLATNPALGYIKPGKEARVLESKQNKVMFCDLCICI